MDPHGVYTERLAARRQVAALDERRHIRLGNLRLAVALAAAVMAWLALSRQVISAWWLVAPGAVFLSLVVIHDRVLRAKGRAERAARFYEQGLARLEDRWIGQGETGERFLTPGHPYAEALDLFGRGSLFELLATVRTRAGEETLARWLGAASEPDAVRARQAAVEELRSRLDLREELALLGEDVRRGVHPEALAAWGERPPLLDSRLARIAAPLLATLTMGTLVWWIATGEGAPFSAVAAVQAAFGYYFRRRVLRVIHAVDQLSEDVRLLSAVLARLEQESFTSRRLVELQRGLEVAGWPPSRRLARLARLIELVQSRHHRLFGAISVLLLWATQLAFAIEAWRYVSGPAVRGWLEALGEMEALSALAGYAFEHPADPFPEFAVDAPCFEGDALGHPLLPEARMVPNDVRLTPDLRLLVVSGSNMSGKSTLLRTVGVNAVLALAGAPVRARRLRLSQLEVGAAMGLVDSLQSGESRFYAEIKRIRLLVDIAQSRPPLLFLLDELLHGTNSHDRRIGAEGVVRGLLERGAFGLVTTHDLALTVVAESVSPPGANVHFEDHLENGRLSFDYLLRPGVVRKSNALELMRSVGLEV